LVENVNGKIKFIYGESKLGGAVPTKNQEMLMEMIKTGNFKAEVRSKNRMSTQTNNFGNQGDRISFDQINMFRGQNVNDITKPIINWAK
jgi:hypothetical protein